MGIGPLELIVLALLWPVVLCFAGYWVIRLAVRHGVMDARRRMPGETRVLD